MKAIFWRAHPDKPNHVQFWTKHDESNMLHTRVKSLSEADIKQQITEMTGVAKFMLVRREKKKVVEQFR